MLRKVCAVAIASVLAAGCLTACGSSKQSGPLTLEQIKENGKLTVATEAAYEPFEYMDGEKIVGYNADLFEAICKDLGVELDYIDLPFQGILAGLEAKKYDSDLRTQGRGSVETSISEKHSANQASNSGRCYPFLLPR